MTEPSGAVRIRRLTDADRPWARSYLLEHWGSDVMAVSRDGAAPELFRPHEHQGFIAERNRDRAGLLTYRVDPMGSFEVTSLTAAPRRSGVGTALIEAAAEEARGKGCRRLWLVTTNDNVDALRFYQRRGLRLVAVRPGAIDEARRLKPGIPAVGNYGIPLHDEIELEVRLESGQDA